jgi:8-oxo-dGTP pyrophosphatase MutT (NUDIX family)
MGDILYKGPDWIFSYRVAGVCLRNGRVLLQQAGADPGFAFPGGHVALGETNEQTLVREFKEEINADITVGPLRWVAENFFPWGDKPCHQICLYYDIVLSGDVLAGDGPFPAREQLEGRDFTVEFSWVPLSALQKVTLYPPQCAALLQHPSTDVSHFIYREP